MQSQGIKRETLNIFEDSYSERIEHVSVQRLSLKPSSSFDVTTVTTPVRRCKPRRQHNSIKFPREDVKISNYLQDEPEDEYDNIETESSKGEV